MTKKEYIQPAVKVVEIRTQVALLMASNVSTSGLGDELEFSSENEGMQAMRGS